MKKLKYLLLAVFVSCAFVLSACGEGQLGVEAQANIGNVEDYTVAETADLDELKGYVATDSEATSDVNSYRMTAEMNMMGMEVKFNLIYAQTTEAFEIALKMDMSAQGEKMAAKMYIKDGWIYMDASGAGGSMKGKQEIPAGTGIEDIQMISALSTLKLDALLEAAKGSLETMGDNVVIKVNTEGTTKRFCIERLDGEEVESRVYFVFEDGKLVACVTEATGMFSATIEALEGKIEYPSFGGYEETDLGLM